MKKNCTFVPANVCFDMTTILMINLKSALLLLVVVLVAVSCARMVSKGRGSGDNALTAYSNVNVDEFQTLIADPAMQLLDVRTQEEFGEGHIAGSVLVDVNDSTFVDEALSLLDAQRPVAVYCRSGRRSARAASLLAERGFKVTNLNGGVMAWQDAGKSLVK